MTPLSAPGAAALVATVLALLLHPRLGLAAALPEPEGLAAALALLLVVALWARGDRLLAGAAVLALVGLGYDSARGVEGTLRLNPGAGTRNFVEQGPDGRSLGLRPLGGEVRLEAIRPGGELALATFDGARTLSPRRAAAVGAYRLGSPRLPASGGAGEVAQASISVSAQPAAALAGLGALLAALAALRRT